MSNLIVTSRSELKKLTNEALMLRYKDGDMQAFNVLYRRYTKEGGKLKPKMKVWLMLRVGTEQDAEDVFQKAWAQITKNAGSYEPYAKFHTYLLKTFERKIIDKRRKLTRPKWKRPKYLGGEDPEKVQISKFTKKSLKPYELADYDKEPISGQGYVGGEQEPVLDPENLSSGNLTEDQVFWQQCAELLRVAIGQLTDKLRDAVLLTFQPPDVLPSEGPSTPDISDDDMLSDEVIEEITAVHPEAMKTRIRNARDKLKKMIPEECYDLLP